MKVFLMLWALPSAVFAQYNYYSFDDHIVITRYTGEESEVTIPSMIENLPVTSLSFYAFASNSIITSVTLPGTLVNISYGAFQRSTNLTSVTFSNGATKVGDYMFNGCSKLTNVNFSDALTVIGDSSFRLCTSLTHVTLPDSITKIDWYAFEGCSNLAEITFSTNLTTIEPWAFGSCVGLESVIISSSVTSIGDAAFHFCSNLTSFYFEGDAPTVGQVALGNYSNAIVYYLPEKGGWSSTLADRATAQWKPDMRVSSSVLSLNTNQFGFEVRWSRGKSVVVEGCTNLVAPTWFPWQTNTLMQNSIYFSEPFWKNNPARFHRVRSF
jgi:hypothetical protein